MWPLCDAMLWSNLLKYNVVTMTVFISQKKNKYIYIYIFFVELLNVNTGYNIYAQ